MFSFPVKYLSFLYGGFLLDKTGEKEVLFQGITKKIRAGF
jgi:hypothetical protein